MPDIDTSPAALRALADGLNPVAGMIWVDHDHQLQIAATLRALAAEKEAATVKPDLTVGAALRALAEAANTEEV